LPKHEHIRIVVNYHFIDAWQGGKPFLLQLMLESGFMRTNIGVDGEMMYSWIENYDYSKGNSQLNICGVSK
jgi:hypothetical protein